MLMMGCGIGLDWSVEHVGDQVRISDVVRHTSRGASPYPGLELLVPSSDYRAEIVAFAQQAKEPFQGIDKSFSNDDDRADYIAFWKEYDQLLGRLTELCA